MIPKVIHYCWFGKNPLPDFVKKCIDSWKKYCPDYDIVLWNEENFDINCCDYVKEAYEEKKWAFVSDYARLKIIYENGGIYLDTDVELIKSLDSVLNEKCFLPMEHSNYIATGLGFGAEKHNDVIKEMLDVYEGLHFKLENGVTDVIPCPRRNTKPFYNTEFDRFSDKIQYVKGATIYPTEYFCPINYDTKQINITENTISIHHYTTTWQPEDEKEYMDKVIYLTKKYGKMVGFIYKMKSQYYQEYKKFNLICIFKFIKHKHKVRTTRRKIQKLNS